MSTVPGIKFFRAALPFFAVLASYCWAETPVFYKDVLPILQTHCQGCHRSGEMAPMPLQTYPQVRPFAKSIADSTRTRSMPPWFAERSPTLCCRHFSNDPSLTDEQIGMLGRWAEAGAPAGDWREASTPPVWVNGWNIDRPDATLKMPVPVKIPAHGDVPYQYLIIPTHFTEDRWVRMSEIRPGNRMVVHHAVAYIREPKSKWLRNAPVGKAFSADDLPDPKDRRDAMWTTSDILLVYAPGSNPDQWPEDYAKLVPAGSDIVLQMHYTAHGTSMNDQTSVGFVFSKEPPKKRVLTLQLTNDHFVIPPGVPDHRVEVHGTIPNDALLLSFFPHMHLRGKSFEYNLIGRDGRKENLLRVPNYDFYWQLSYRLTTPVALKAGSTLQAIASFDNSRGNPHNPDPDSAVRWGEQTWAEMMVGFFDVAIDPGLDKEHFFIRTGRAPVDRSQ